MDKTVMGLFEENDAEEVVKTLRHSGVPLANINAIDEEPEGEVIEGTTAKLEGVKEEIVEKSKALWERLKGFFGESVPEHHRHYLAEGIRRGGTLVAVDVPEVQADRVRQLMEEHHVIDLDVQSVAWRQGGWSGVPEEASATVELGSVQVYQRPVMPRMPPPRASAQSELGETQVDEEAFQLGKELGTSEEPSREWPSIEREARRRWEVKHPGTWDRFKEIVRDAWDQSLGEKHS